jgi:hypothetical protein
MRFRSLGRSGLKVSEITYGNWITHGGQVGEDAAAACVRAALEHGITTFDTADVYAGGAAEEVLGRALAGERRDGLEILTKVYWPTGPGPNDRGLSRKHILASIDASLRRLGTDYVDLYQAHRFDHETPVEETVLAFGDVVRAGKARYIGVSEWRAEQIREAKALADELHVPLVANQPQYSALYRLTSSPCLKAGDSSPHELGFLLHRVLLEVAPESDATSTGIRSRSSRIPIDRRYRCCCPRPGRSSRPRVCGGRGQIRRYHAGRTALAVPHSSPRLKPGASCGGTG